MVTKLKGKFLPRDQQLSLFRKMHNLKKKKLTVKEYTEEFCKVNIRERYVEENPKREAIYINVLIFDIQDEMNLLSPSSVEEAYQFVSKVEEKMARKSQGKSEVSFKG